jgi:hypothetical protein
VKPFPRPARSAPMTAGFFEWVVRTAMLVLAGLVTLSILGSIAALSNDSGARRGSGAGNAPVQPVPVRDAAPEEASPEAGPRAAAAADDTGPGPVTAGGTGSGTIVAAAPTAEDGPERWLEAISYALLALAGLVAIGLLLLWRGARQLGRIADALEARPRN